MLGKNDKKDLLNQSKSEIGPGEIDISHPLDFVMAQAMRQGKHLERSDGTCWCFPDLYIDDETGNAVWVHKEWVQ